MVTFDEQMLDIMNKSALALMLSIGHRTKLFDVMAEESNQTVLAELIDGILPIVSGAIDKLHQGIKVLDIGCGSGRAINLMAKTFPSSHFSGYDFLAEGISNAKNEMNKLGLKNVTFEQQDAAHFDHVEHFDLITAFDAIHDQAHPDKVLENIYLSLKPDGVFLMQDIAGSSKLENNMQHPLAPFLYTISCLHCMTVSLALDGKGLGAMWGKEKATEMLHAAGFSKVEVKQLPHDPINYFYVAKM